MRKILNCTGITRRFRGLKSQWGFSKFISKKTLLDPSNGYLGDDICVFGAEVFIVKREAVTECLSLKNVYSEHYKHEFKISNFSELENVWHSEEFNVGCHIWYHFLALNVGLYPKGAQEGTSSHVGISLLYNWGFFKFIDIATINDPGKGFIVNDCCILTLEISILAVVQRSPLS
ncbi:PREDICTED: uncharacterized protein LOC105957274 [Erythranthe guttata]|uniref:uncharacterized protein LOC105957274 n=1 Tax=Erythranthe guttata TaxID=4155 RepID=UPI00064E015B|nr:PREDICTED: uncharacterized protein LOC105957274 [Erythranthe guttata]|eukprot:XP_012836662.1 PREDICTED: uncharacterized protein LOC105957274 [Erythranthe guttata]